MIYVNHQRIGYAYSQTRIDDQGKQKRIHNQSNSYLKLKRFGQTLNMETHLSTIETAEGELLSYTFQMKNPPADSTISEGKVKDGQLIVETKVANQTNRSQLEMGIGISLTQLS